MLIGLTGPKQAGKDTVFERAAHILADVLPVERASFADALYASAAAALGVDVETLRRYKSDPDVHVALVHTYHWGDPWFMKSQTLREYLQRYGTEAHREVFGDDFWVDNVRLDHAGKLVMVTDVRFPNEAAAVRRSGGLVVRVVGPPDVENTGDGHASEAGLPDTLIDGYVTNLVRDDNFRSLDAALEPLLRQLLNTEVGSR